MSTSRLEPTDPETSAVAFLDLSGFTALTEAHGDQHAADLALQLAAYARSALGNGDRLVKTLGDAVMLTSPTPERALALIVRIVDAWVTRAGNVPILRGGLHYGPVVRRADDVYGNTVNLAARVAGAAKNDQILLTDPIAHAALAAKLPLSHLGPRRFRNITDTVEVYALDIDCLCGQVDPVCRMRIRPDSARARLNYEGVEYDFCSPTCADSFRARPDRYTSAVECGAASDPTSPSGSN
ncbi:YHS domain-containing protein [Antrihabitans sp. YC3-6]|uniref:YHS domain-containing protein n=1 Tax=Antrihabitans stalagmiti TaxID=2799499 RepID=A0A934NTD1_9NOCA|nr:YHS domain-containing protein [Antrihabitans stalagmiti]MBJ8340820.1 YHS domain-containing protein [Antrihabitans stalagmiti]